MLLQAGETAVFMKTNSNRNIVIGIQPIKEAINSGKTIDKLLFKKGVKSDAFTEISSQARKLGVPVQYVPSQRLDKITRKNHQGVIAFISPIEFQDLENVVSMAFDAGENPLIVLLDGVTDVRNFGAIVRSAECLGAHAVVIPQREAAAINEAAIKSSAGAILKMNICREKSLSESCKALKNSGLQIISCTEDEQTALWSQDLTIPCCLVLGAEGEGVSRDILGLCDSGVHIPMSGSVQSLNVSVAAGIVLSEVARQRFISEV